MKSHCDLIESLADRLFDSLQESAKKGFFKALKMSFHAPIGKFLTG
jgi:hypothetical protein